MSLNKIAKYARIATNIVGYLLREHKKKTDRQHADHNNRNKIDEGNKQEKF